MDNSVLCSVLFKGGGGIRRLVRWTGIYLITSPWRWPEFYLFLTNLKAPLLFFFFFFGGGHLGAVGKNVLAALAYFHLIKLYGKRVGSIIHLKLCPCPPEKCKSVAKPCTFNSFSVTTNSRGKFCAPQWHIVPLSHQLVVRFVLSDIWFFVGSGCNRRHLTECNCMPTETEQQSCGPQKLAERS